MQHAPRTEAQHFWHQLEQQRVQQRRAAPPRLGLELPPPPLPISIALGASVRPIDELDRWQNHPGHGLEPQRVLQAYRLAEQGYPMEQVDMFDDVVEVDGHGRSVIHARTLAVAGKKWQVMAGGDRPIDRTAAEVLQDALRPTNFDDMVAHLLSARYGGFAGAEIDWRDFDGDIVPNWFVNVPHRRFRFGAGDVPRITRTVADYEGVPLAPGQWVFGSNAIAGNKARSGLLRTGLWFMLFKRWSWRDWVIYGEKFGIPLVMGTYEQHAQPEDIATLERAVTNIGEAGQAVASDATNITIHETEQGSASTSLHAGIVREANNEISKLITGSTLTVESGGPGSFALGKVHETRAFDLVLADAKFVARRFAQDIARPFLAYNGFADARVPELVIHVTRETDPLTRAQLAEKLQGMGLKLDSEQLREEFQFRAPPTPDRELVAPAPSPSPIESGDA